VFLTGGIAGAFMSCNIYWLISFIYFVSFDYILPWKKWMIFKYD
jgi:hypothetical protein